MLIHAAFGRVGKAVECALKLPRQPAQLRKIHTPVLLRAETGRRALDGFPRNEEILDTGVRYVKDAIAAVLPLLLNGDKSERTMRLPSRRPAEISADREGRMFSLNASEWRIL